MITHIRGISIFFSALAQSLTSEAKKSSLDYAASWAPALQQALDTLYRYTRARPPSRTLIDPLHAFISTLSSYGDIAKAVKKASDAADNTANIQAKAGRSAYVGQQHLNGVVDPGALGIKVILEALLTVSTSGH
jgi:dihydroxyacetone kinase